MIWQGSFAGKLPKVNDWHGARINNRHARIFETTKYKTEKESLAVAFLASRPAETITCAVDMRVTVSLWKMVDTDAPMKAIMDCLEAAGVVKNDRQIRSVEIARSYHKRGEPDQLTVELYETAIQ